MGSAAAGTGEKKGETTGETGETTARTVAADRSRAQPYAGHALFRGLERSRRMA
jgi:hypothetical protein